MSTQPQSQPSFFLDFFQTLREFKVPVVFNEWMTFVRALELGLHDHHLEGFYELGRLTLVKSESHLDAYDLAFQRYFRNLPIPTPQDLRNDLLEWLKDPAMQRLFPPEMLQNLPNRTLDELLKMLEERLQSQTERHDYGNQWIGTRGTSPFGNSGAAPVPGIRIGGEGGNRSAIMVAGDRRFKNYRSDLVLDIRQVKMALRKLRVLLREGEEELDLEETIDQSCRNGGEIDLRFRKSRKNKVKLLLLMDTGGSMTPYATLVNRLFSAAHQSSHFKDFKHYYFHNIPYGKLYTDYWKGEFVTLDEVTKMCDKDYKVIFVGDACMASYELHNSWFGEGKLNGLGCIQILKEHFKSCIWLNPEAWWDHPTVKEISAVVPMFPLTLDGLEAGVKRLRYGK